VAVHNRVHQAVAPTYLFLCLLIGGSAQGVWGNMLLQLLGIATVAWAAAARVQEPLVAPARQLLLLASVAIVVVVLQLIPLPASVWPNLGGRPAIASGYRVLGLATPAFPISLTPYKSLDSLLGLIPPLAVFCAVVRLKAYRPSWLAAALVAGTVAGILLGALQVANSDPESLRWYPYAETNYGLAVGFFANANHMAILLVITLPFLAAVLAAGRRINFQRYTALVAAVVGAGLLILVGIALNTSLAAYGLALPVLAASLLIVIPQRSRARPWLLAAAGLLLIGVVAALANSTVGSAKIDQDTASSVQSREAILATTANALTDFMPLGSGLGSFREVYQMYEKPAEVTPTYVIHVHNDYVELALETGLLGIAVMLMFLAWWGAAVWRVWRSAEAGPFARAASIASAAILIHSLVDFPLRTAAISACFGMCLALLADRRTPPATEKSDLRPTRHFVLR
jgi:O-antigen ligase